MLRVVGLVALASITAVACFRRTDPGFDVVAVPSAAYLAAASPEGGAVPDGGAREAGVVALSTKCEAPPEDEFEPSDDIPECPSENSVGWPLEPRTTTRHRDKDENVCCYKRGVVRVPEVE